MECRGDPDKLCVLTWAGAIVLPVVPELPSQKLCLTVFVHIAEGSGIPSSASFLQSCLGGTSPRASLLSAGLSTAPWAHVAAA